MKLLLAEDDRALAEHLILNLKRSDYVIEWAANGVDAEFIGLEENFDCIILDLGLPQKSGLDVLKNWRMKDLDTPVLVLTARDSWQERVDGLKAGADDYLGKPFHMAELIARLEALLRRRFGHCDNKLEYGGVVLDIDNHTLTTVNDEKIQLTAIEFRLLRYLMLNPHKIISKTELSEHIYEEEQLKDSNVIEVYINRLRSLLGKSWIKTYRGQGYRLSDQ